MDILQKGYEGELALNAWLKSNCLSYLHVDQSLETFATLFNGSLKRPDFLVLLESIGMIAVDAKNKQLWENEYFSLGFESEFQKALSFERIFRIPLWYAYLCQKDGREVWYWISALKAMEVGKFRTNSQSGEQFLVLHLNNFEEISSAMDLGKLYTHRLQSLKPMSRFYGSANDNSSAAPDTKAAARIAFEDVYDLSNDYHAKDIEKVLCWLEYDVGFPIFYRKGEDRHFSTKDEVCDGDVVAVIDALSKKIMMEAGAFCEAITNLGHPVKGGGSIVLDHLIYAVNSVSYDDGGGSSYQVQIDDKRLTDIGLKIVRDLRAREFMLQISRNEDYMLCATIA